MHIRNMIPQLRRLVLIVVVGALALGVLGCDLFPTQPTFEGTYKATLPAADASALEMTLALNADKTCTLSSLYVGKSDKPSVDKGQWSSSGNSITIDMTPADGEAPYQITFELKDGELVPTKWTVGWGQDLRMKKQ